MFVFRLVNDYPLHIMLTNIARNARVVFMIFFLLICAGGISLLLAVQEKWDELWVVFFLFIIAAILILPLALFLYYDYYRSKYGKYSLFQSPSDALARYDREIRTCRLIGNRVGISDHHIFALTSSWYVPVAIPLRDISAIYFLRYYTKRGYRCSDCFYVLTHERDVVKVPLGAAFIYKAGGFQLFKHSEPPDQRVMSIINSCLPGIFLGWKAGMFPTKDVTRLHKTEL